MGILGCHRLFKLMNFEKNVKIGLSCVGKMYRVIAILSIYLHILLLIHHYLKTIYGNSKYQKR